MSASFREFERAGWERASAAYARSFVDVTRGVFGPLLAATETGRGARVLDVATGPGGLAAEALARGARPCGVDFSPRMAALAARIAPAVTGDVVALPFRESSFDAVLCSFGLLHFAEPDRAVAEMARVARTGGRVALSVWAPPHDNAFFGAIYRALEKHASKKPEIPAAAPMFHFADGGNMAQLLGKAGLRDRRVERVAWKARVASGRALVELFAEGSVRTAALLAAQDAAAIERIVGYVEAEIAPFHGEVPVTAIIGTASKP